MRRTARSSCDSSRIASSGPRSRCVVRRKTVALSHSYINAILLPRQARDKHRENGCVITFQSVFVTHVCPTPVWANRWFFHIHFTKTRTDGGIFLCDRRFTPRTSRTMKERPCRCSPWVALTLGSHSTFTKMATPRCCGVASSGVSTRRGQKNGSFEPFIHPNDHFTKTGSGQT